MCNFLKQAIAKNKKNNALKSTEQEHWVNHIYDESKFWPNQGAMWANFHGFDEGPGQVYWVGVDTRSFGIRVADTVIKCKNKSTYDEYINMSPTEIDTVLKHDPRLTWKDGNDTEIEFIFKWGDDDKSFNVRLGTDYYAEEK